MCGSKHRHDQCAQLQLLNRHRGATQRSPAESIPCPIGYYVGNRLGYANSTIYYWQGSPQNRTKWICGGDAFYMFEFEADVLKGDLNGDNRITTADAVIALQITVSGEHDDNADMNGDGRVSSVDALMILQAASM